MGPTVKQWFKQRSRVITDSYVERYMYSHTAYSIRHMVCAVVCQRQCEFDIKCLHCANTFVNEAIQLGARTQSEHLIERPLRLSVSTETDSCCCVKSVTEVIRATESVVEWYECDSPESDLRTVRFPNFSLAGERVGFMQRVLGLRQCWIAV